MLDWFLVALGAVMFVGLSLALWLRLTWPEPDTHDDDPDAGRDWHAPDEGGESG